MTVLSQLFLPLVCSDFFPFTFSTAGHWNYSLQFNLICFGFNSDYYPQSHYYSNHPVDGQPLVNEKLKTQKRLFL